MEETNRSESNRGGCWSVVRLVLVFIATLVGLVGLGATAAGLVFGSFGAFGIGAALLTVSAFIFVARKDDRADADSSSNPSESHDDRPAGARLLAADDIFRSTERCPECDVAQPTALTATDGWRYCPSCGEQWESKAERSGTARQLDLFERFEYSPVASEQPERFDQPPPEQKEPAEPSAPAESEKSSQDEPAHEPITTEAPADRAAVESTQPGETAEETETSESESPTSAGTEPVPDEPDVWSNRLFPLIADNWLYLLGSILVLGSGAYAIAYTWQTLSTVVRHLMVTGLLTAGAASFAGVGRWLESRFETAKGADVFWLIGAGLVIAAAVSAGLAYPFSITLGAGLTAAVAIFGPLIVSWLHPLRARGDAKLPFVTWTSPFLLTGLALSTQQEILASGTILLTIISGAIVVLGALVVPPPGAGAFLDGSEEIAGDYSATLHWMTTAAWPIVLALCTIGMAGVRLPSATTGDALAVMAPGVSLLCLAAVELCRDGDVIAEHRTSIALFASAIAAAAAGAALWDPMALFAASIAAAITHIRARPAYPATEYGAVLMLAAASHAVFVLMTPVLGLPAESASLGGRLLAATAPLSVILAAVARHTGEETARRLAVSVGLLPVVPLAVALFALTNAQVTWLELAGCLVHGASASALAIHRDETLLMYLSAALGVSAALFTPAVSEAPEPIAVGLTAGIAVAATAGAVLLESAEISPESQRGLTQIAVLLTLASPILLWTIPTARTAIAGGAIGSTARAVVTSLGSLCIASIAVLWIARRTGRQFLVWIGLVIFGGSAVLSVSLIKALIGYESSGAGRLVATGVVAVALTEVILRFDSLVREPGERSSIFGLEPPDEETPRAFLTPFRVFAYFGLAAGIILPLLPGSPIWAAVALSLLAGVAALRICGAESDARLAGILAPLVLAAWVPQTVATAFERPSPQEVVIAAVGIGVIWEAGKWLMSRRWPSLVALHATGLRLVDDETDSNGELEELATSLRTLWQTTLITSGLLLAVLAVAATVTTAPAVISGWHYLGLAGLVLLAGSDLWIRPSRGAALFLTFASVLGLFRAYGFALPDTLPNAAISCGAGVALYTGVWWALDATDLSPRGDLFRRWIGTASYLGSLLFVVTFGFLGTTMLDGARPATAHGAMLVGALLVAGSALMLYRRCRNIPSAFLAAAAPIVAALLGAHLCWSIGSVEWISLAPFIALVAVGIGFSLQYLFPNDWPDIDADRDAFIVEIPPGIPAIDRFIPRFRKDTPTGFPRSHETGWRYLYNALAMGLGGWALFRVGALLLTTVESVRVEVSAPLTILTVGLAAIVVSIPRLVERNLRLPETFAAIAGALAVGAASTGLLTYDVVAVTIGAAALLLAFERALWRRRGADGHSLSPVDAVSWLLIVLVTAAVAEIAVRDAVTACVLLSVPAVAIAVRFADQFDRATARVAVVWSLVALPTLSFVLGGGSTTAIIVGALLVPAIWSIVAECARRVVAGREEAEGETESTSIAGILEVEAATGASMSNLVVLLSAAAFIGFALESPAYAPSTVVGLSACGGLVAVSIVQFAEFPVHLSRTNLILALTIAAVSATLPFEGLQRLHVLYVGLAILAAGTAVIGRLQLLPGPEEALSWLPSANKFKHRSRPPVDSMHLWLPLALWGSAAGLGLAFTSEVGAPAVGAAALLVVASITAPVPGGAAENDWIRELMQVGSIVLIVGTLGQPYWEQPIVFATGLLATGLSLACLWLAIRSRYAFAVELCTGSALVLCLMAFGRAQPGVVAEWITAGGFGLVAAAWMLRLLRDDVEFDGYFAAVALAAGYAFVRVRIGLLPATADPWVAQGAGLLILILESFARSDESNKLRRVTLVLTLVLPTVGWVVSFLTQPDMQPGVLAGGGSLFLLAGWQLKARGMFIPALLVFNAEVLAAWWRADIVEPVLYALPVGFTLIAFARIYAERLGQSGRNWLRGFGCLIIYATGSYHLFAFEGLQPVLITAGLAVAGVIAGLVLRVRSYLYFGTIALLFDLGVNLFRVGTQDTLTGTAILFVLGVLMLAAGVTYNVRREAIRSRLEHIRRTLREWE